MIFYSGIHLRLLLSREQNAVLTHEVGAQRRGLMNTALPQDSTMGGQGLAEWRHEMEQLMEQKRTVERELGELKTQLEKCGFTSLSQMRCRATAIIKGGLYMQFSV